MCTGPSSNGRTEDFESSSLGSNPSGPMWEIPTCSTVKPKKGKVMRNLTFGLMLLFVAACGGDVAVEDQTTDSVTTGDVVVDTTSTGGSLDGATELDTPVDSVDNTGEQF